MNACILLGFPQTDMCSRTYMLFALKNVWYFLSLCFFFRNRTGSVRRPWGGLARYQWRWLLHSRHYSADGCCCLHYSQFHCGIIICQKLLNFIGCLQRKTQSNFSELELALANNVQQIFQYQPRSADCNNQICDIWVSQVYTVFVFDLWGTPHDDKSETSDYVYNAKMTKQVEMVAFGEHAKSCWFSFCLTKVCCPEFLVT